MGDDPGRITGPLTTWYDLHEAIAHEVRALATAAETLEETTIEPFGRRFGWFAEELRTHSEVEDGIMFPAIERGGGRIDAGLHDEHLGEQALVYDASWTVLDAEVHPTPDAFGRVADLVARLRDRLIPHLQLEEEIVLPQVPVHFDDDAQAELLRTIIHSIPPDPRLQPWVAGALTPEHREARLRNMADSLAPEVLATVLRQIEDGVDDSVWADIRARTPELARLVDDS